MSEQNIKFIYFDLDDTLLDHKKAEVAGLNDVHKHFSELKAISFRELRETYHDINKDLWIDYAAGKIDRKFLHRKRFERTFEKLNINSGLYEQAGKVYMNYYRNHWEWIEGAESAYHHIREKYPVGIITNGFSETQKMKIDQFGFRDHTDAIVISEDVGVMKPHPDIFNHAAELAGVKNEEILYIGDSLTSDVEGGKSAGWKVAWYNRLKDGNSSDKADLSFERFDQLLKWLVLSS